MGGRWTPLGRMAKLPEKRERMVAVGGGVREAGLRYGGVEVNSRGGEGVMKCGGEEVKRPRTQVNGWVPDNDFGNDDISDDCKLEIDNCKLQIEGEGEDE